MHITMGKTVERSRFGLGRENVGTAFMDYNDVYREDAELESSLGGNTKRMDAIVML